MPITNPPINPGSGGTNLRQSFVEINPFLFVKGSYVYQVLADTTRTGGGYMAVVKSTAAGVTSAPLDASNAPQTHAFSWVCYSNPTSSLITIAYWGPSTIVRIIEFDTATDTYGTPIVSTLNANTAFLRGCGVFFESSNALYFVTYVNNSNGKLEYVTIDGGGTTSAAVVIDTAESGGQGLFYTSYNDDTGFAYLFYLQSIASGNFKVVLLAARFFFVGTPLLIATDGVEWVDVDIDGYLGIDNVAWINGDGTKVKAAFLDAGFFPSISGIATLDSVVYPTQVTYVSIARNAAGTITTFWLVTDFSFDPGIDEIDFSAFRSAGWTAPLVYYDAVANPPSGALPYPSNFLHTLQTVQIGGGWFVASAMETGDCTGFIMQTGPLGLACPVGGGTASIGVPYSKTLSTVGGIPPYTWELLLGTLPPGLTLNTTTGVISGTPTTPGTYTYVVRAIDSFGTVVST